VPVSIIVLFIAGRDRAKTRTIPAEATKISAFHWEEVFPEGLSDMKSNHRL